MRTRRGSLSRGKPGKKIEAWRLTGTLRRPPLIWMPFASIQLYCASDTVSPLSSRSRSMVRAESPGSQSSGWGCFGGIALLDPMPTSEVEPTE